MKSNDLDSPYDSPKSFYYDLSAWILMGIFLLGTLLLHLLPALIAGLLVCELVKRIVPLLPSSLSHGVARGWAVFLIATTVTIILISIIVGLLMFFNSSTGDISLLFKKLAEILEGSKGKLPAWIWDYIPTSADEIRATVTEWFRKHSTFLQKKGAEFGIALVQILVGFIIGSFISLHDGKTQHWGPLAKALLERAKRLSSSFSQIVFAQMWISGLNTSITAIYLVFILPAFGIELPLVKTMIAVTFCVGLIPVLGNLISNTVIVLVSFSNSLVIALISLAYLIVIHKLEYFVNARIIGGRISAQAWELLIAMLVMEAAFGVPGVIAAPICYAYIKKELSDRNLI